MDKLEEASDKYNQVIDRVISNFNKRFMEKADSKIQFRSFERQIKGIFDYMVAKFDETDVNEAMLQKKQVGWSCASCQKNLCNI